MAATTLTFVEPGYIDRQGVGADALDKTMDALVMVQNQTVLQGSPFFRTVMSKNGSYKEAGIGDDMPLPVKSEDSDRMPRATPTPDFNKTVTVTNRRMSIAVERSFVEDDIQGVARKMMGGLLRVGRLSIEYGMADIFNNLTTDSATYWGGDGVSIANDSHPYARRETGTWDNLGTAAALTSANLFTEIKALRQRTDTRGYKAPLKPRVVIVPPDLEKKVAEIKGSTLVPENAMNTKNVVPQLGGGWQYMVYDYLTDTNAWILWADVPQDQNGFLYFPKAVPSVGPLEGADKSTDIVWGQRLRMRVGFGARHGRGLQYNAGA